MFNGKVMAKAMGKNNPGFASGAAIFIAAGTAIYDALAANTDKINRLDTSAVTNELAHATTQPLISGTTMAKIKGNQPLLVNELSFRP